MSSAPKIPLVQLHDGSQIPALGFGTGTIWFKLDRFAEYNPAAASIATEAIKAGYRHLDASEGYGTETELGNAIRESGVPREELFITTEVIHSIAEGEGKVEDLPEAFEQSLKRLQTDYVDLFMLHSPYVTNNKYDEDKVAKAWTYIEAIHKSGKALIIGISDFRRNHVENLLKTAKIKPAIIQIHFNPYVQGGT